MKHRSKTPLFGSIDPTGRTGIIGRRDALCLTALASVLAVAGCGGGADESVAGVTSGGTGSFSTGPITGFGSIIVGAIRFDDSKASSVVDMDDDNTDLRGQLKLGMVVRVKAQAIVGSAADAQTIEVRSELLGPISRIDGATLTVLGQGISVTANTFFGDGLVGASSLALGNIVEVHGFVDAANNTITATRIERKTLASAKAFKLQGSVRGLLASRFQIGELVMNASAAAAVPNGLVLANGLLVRVRLEPVLSAGVRQAISIRAVELEVLDRDQAQVGGTVTALTSAGQLSINGVAVDARGAGLPPGLKLGDRVDVQGALVKGVLVPKQIKLEDEKDPLKFELNGSVSSLNKTAKTFVVRSVTVDYSAAEFKDGSATNLVDGARVEVKGVAAAEGSQIKATRIAFN